MHVAFGSINVIYIFFLEKNGLTLRMLRVHVLVMSQLVTIATDSLQTSPKCVLWINTEDVMYNPRLNSALKSGSLLA